MRSRLLNFDPISKVRSLFHGGTDGDDFVVEEVQDVTEVLEANKRAFNEFDERTPWNPEMNQVASIPLVVWEGLKRKGIADDNKALMRWLDDPDNRAFRTRPGRLS